MQSDRLRRYFMNLHTLKELFEASQDPLKLHIFSLPQYRLPKTAKLVHVYQTYDHRGIWFIFSDDSFDPVAEGEEIPVYMHEELTIKCDFRVDKQVGMPIKGGVPYP